jgi:hypothetical protein
MGVRKTSHRLTGKKMTNPETSRMRGTFDSRGNFKKKILLYLKEISEENKDGDKGKQHLVGKKKKISTHLNELVKNKTILKKTRPYYPKGSPLPPGQHKRFFFFHTTTCGQLVKYGGLLFNVFNANSWAKKLK